MITCIRSHDSDCLGGEDRQFLSGVTRAHERMRTSLNIPDEVLAEFDAVWQSEGFDSRSRAVREAIQEYVETHSKLEDMSGSVAAVIVFDYEHEEVIRELHGIQHGFQAEINATSHVHEGEWCLETVFCRGEAARIRELVYQLRDFDGVGRVKLLSLRNLDG